MTKGEDLDGDSGLKLPALDPATIMPALGSNYPAVFKPQVAGRSKRRLGEALGLRNFGVNLTTVKPGSASALRHWHTTQDEFVYVVSGELTLVTDSGEQVLTAGMAAGFQAGKADGHHLVNRSSGDAVYLEVGDRAPGDQVTYPDDDLEARAAGGNWKFFRKNGAPY
jgi:uncharacterized cupin superfamily protein